ncbi:MAG: hypothetical protein ABIQ39_15930 [Ilumatobacteraceae bacterium]
MSDECRLRRGDLAMRALHLADQADVEAEALFAAHLAGCVSCRCDLDELIETAAALEALRMEEINEYAASTGHQSETGPMSESALQPAAAPDALGSRIIGAVEAGIAARRHRRRHRALLAAAAVVVVGLAVSFAAIAMRQTHESNAQPVRLSGPGSLSATANLAARPWGTQVAFTVTGLDDGEIYWLWLTGSDGKRVAAGTLLGSGPSLKAVLASAIKISDARRIWLTDADGTVVLDATLHPADLP